jgi:DNA polymerase gamma 1
VFNEIGVQHLPDSVRNQLFKRPSKALGADEKKEREKLIQLAQKHLEKHELLGKTTEPAPPISFELPALQGETLDEHFYKLGREASEPYLTHAKKFAMPDMDLPDPPTHFVTEVPGWTKYVQGGDLPVSVDAPEEDMLVFDVEVLYKQSPFAIMACAASPTAWYSWISPWLLGESESNQHLVPLGNPNKERIVVGHNVGYDRARILEEYSIKPTKTAFLDTMSLHVAVNGMCSRQRPTWMKHAKTKERREKAVSETDSPELAELLQNGIEVDEPELWVGRSSINSLRDVAKFHCNVTIDKAVRDQFGTLDREGVKEKLHDLLIYCAADVAVTHKVYKMVFPRFLEICPHPVSFGALRHLSSVTLPVNDTWEEYIKNAEEKYQEMLKGVGDRLQELVKNALKEGMKRDPDNLEEDLDNAEDLGEGPDNVKDPAEGLDEWLQQLDWSGQEIKMTKPTKKHPKGRRYANQKMPGYPKWYKDLFTNTKGKEPEMNVTTRSRIAPLLLKMTWADRPLIWSDLHGWTIRVKPEEVKTYADSPVVKVSMAEEKNPKLQGDTDHVYFKLPHKDGPQARCTAVLAKSYQQYFEAGVLASNTPLAKEALIMNAECSYWISARERIKSQMVVYADNPGVDFGLKSDEKAPKPGIILPQVIPMGTITRRAVENTWLTASNAKKNRVGSELKAMVKAPPGYVFVGADVDSEELWIASLVGDAQFKLHGGGALGFMTLEGTKSAGTDLHSKTAKILGISRNHAKVFNYGRIYGAGLKFASTLLRQFNPKVSDAQATKTAENLYRETKGAKTMKKTIFPRGFWRGGTESLVFNKLEEFAEQDFPRTPVLGAGITEALQRKYINKGGFLTSRINWAIQSSGVDYLHLLIVSMDYLIRSYGLDARLAITVHDEIRYLVKEKDKYRVALALQIANVWTRAMFSQQMGIEDLPQSCAWFSAVDIDSVLRKEVDLDCVTPSHPNAIPPGECVDIQTLLTMPEDDVALDESNGVKINLEGIKYTPRTPVMEMMNSSDGKSNKQLDLWRLEAQIADEIEVESIAKKIYQFQKEEEAKNTVKTQEYYDGVLGVWNRPSQVKLPAYKGLKKSGTYPKKTYRDYSYDM